MTSINCSGLGVLVYAAASNDHANALKVAGGRLAEAEALAAYGSGCSSDDCSYSGPGVHTGLILGSEIKSESSNSGSESEGGRDSELGASLWQRA